MLMDTAPQGDLLVQATCQRLSPPGGQPLAPDELAPFEAGVLAGFVLARAAAGLLDGRQLRRHIRVYIRRSPENPVT